MNETCPYGSTARMLTLHSPNNIHDNVEAQTKKKQFKHNNCCWEGVQIRLRNREFGWKKRDILRS